MGGPGSGGRNRKNADIKELEGNPGKRSYNKVTSQDSPEGLPTCPGWLSPEAKREWRRICREVKTLTKKSRGILAAYCSAYARWRKAEEELIKNGLTCPARHGEKARPEVKIAADALAQMKGFAIELGLTPKSRVTVVEKPNEPQDPLEEILDKNRQN